MEAGMDVDVELELEMEMQMSLSLPVAPLAIELIRQKAIKRIDLLRMSTRDPARDSCVLREPPAPALPPPATPFFIHKFHCQ